MGFDYIGSWGVPSRPTINLVGTPALSLQIVKIP